jgi:hypothetical protein
MRRWECDVRRLLDSRLLSRLRRSRLGFVCRRDPGKVSLRNAGIRGWRGGGIKASRNGLYIQLGRESNRESLYQPEGHFASLEKKRCYCTVPVSLSDIVRVF